MNEKNQITEGVIWKQLLLFFFPVVAGTFLQQIYNAATRLLSVVLWVKRLWRR